MTMNIDAAEAIRKQAAEKMELNKYKYIMDNVKNVDVSRDDAFQKAFNGFYVVRRDKSKWGKAYYEYFEKNKGNKALTFADIITHIYDTKAFHTEKGNPRCEMSFSSKLLATIQPDKPIWDKHVCEEFLGMKSQKVPETEIQEYAKLEDWYNSFLKTPDAKKWIAAFDSAFPAYTWISKTKKIDFIIFWNQKN